jgi:hypothetical protein
MLFGILVVLVVLLLVSVFLWIRETVRRVVAGLTGWIGAEKE